MNPQLIESMRDQACAIYRAVTGSDLPAAESAGGPSDTPEEDVTRSFAELEALTRANPLLAQRLPPFSFTPALDAIFEGSDLVIEVAVPGIERNDVSVECAQGELVLSGIRRALVNGERTYSHGEIPRGPFYRIYHIPFAIEGEPAVTLERGLLRVRLKRSPDQPQQDSQQRQTDQKHPQQQGTGTDSQEFQRQDKRPAQEASSSSSPTSAEQNLTSSEGGEHGTGDARSSATQPGDPDGNAGSPKRRGPDRRR